MADDDICGQSVTIDGARFVCNLPPGHWSVEHCAMGDVPVRFTLYWRMLP